MLVTCALHACNLKFPFSVMMYSFEEKALLHIISNFYEPRWKGEEKKSFSFSRHSTAWTPQKLRKTLTTEESSCHQQCVGNVYSLSKMEWDLRSENHLDKNNFQAEPKAISDIKIMVYFSTNGSSGLKDFSAIY